MTSATYTHARNRHQWGADVAWLAKPSLDAGLAAAMDLVADAVMVATPDAVVRYVNAAHERVTGYSREESIGRRPRLLKNPEQDEAFCREVRQRLLRGETWAGRLVGLRRDGAPYEAETTFSPVAGDDGAVAYFVIAARDVTRQCALEAQFRQAQKMEALGRLAAGIVHDFNNQLAVIQGYCDLTLRDLPIDGTSRKSIEHARRASERAAGTAARLLSLSRQHTAKTARFSLDEVLRDLANPLARLIGEDIRLAVRPSPGLGLVDLDRGLLEQAVMNLVINARDAMPRGGRLTVETSRATVAAGDATAAGDAVPAGDYAILAVADTGTGMDAETMRQIFDPFFTTKPDGKGTGLGLAMVCGFMKESGGHVRVASRPGEGTTFRLYFPRREAAVDVAPPQAAAAGCPRGTETVLVAEDDETLRGLVVQMLSECGYRVLAGAGAAEALALGCGCDGLDLLITDVIMPDMSGPDLVARLRETHPAVRVLYASGHTRGTLERHGLTELNEGLLAKPFGLKDLAERVRRVMDCDKVRRRAARVELL